MNRKQAVKAAKKLLKKYDSIKKMPLVICFDDKEIPEDYNGVILNITTREDSFEGTEERD